MIVKAAITYLTAFAAIAFLLIASDSLAFEQVDRGGSKHQSPETASQAEALFLNAMLLADTEERESARLQLQAAMRIWVQLREPGKAAKAALQMGDIYKQARKYQDALNCYRQALDVKSPPGAVRANALNVIALIYAELHLHNLAVSYFDQALNQARSIDDLPAQTFALTGLADLYIQQRAMGKALACIRQALRLNKEGHADADPALLYLKGRVSQEQGAVKNAKDAFEETLAIYRKTRNTAGQVRVLCALSTLALLASQKQAAIEQAEQAVDLAEKQAKRAVSSADFVNARELQWRAWLSSARAERALGQKERALRSYRRAINHFEAMWWAVYSGTEASAIAFREEALPAYRECVDLLIEQGQFKQAYDRAEEAKARTILNFTGARRVRPPSKDRNEGTTLHEPSRPIARLRLQLIASNLSRGEQAKIQKEIEDEEFKLQEAQSQAEMKHSRERLVWSQLANAEQLQKQVAEDQMALAEFSLGEDRSFVWLFTRGELFFEILPARQEIDNAVRAYLDLLATTPNYLHIERDLVKLRAEAETLFAKLFGRLSRQIEQGQRLMVIPDGLLHYLPFEALIHNGRYLVEDHEISYNASASMLGLWRDADSRVHSGDKLELLALGDPDFEPKATALGRKHSKKGSHNPAQQMLAARGFRLAPLPRTRDEIQYIADLFPADRRRVFLGSESTETALKREPLWRYRRLHFATHSLIDEKFPSRSAIMLTPDGIAEEDGYLEASEIARLHLDCDLVVVSACQTGRGKLLSGEGIVGLSRAFLYAGARSVVVSLWNVSDISTGQLMKNFYQHLTGGLRNAAALRRAKLQMLGSDKETRHPYYWSSFVMVGKP
jgi:CHAT domain-containing protein